MFRKTPLGPRSSISARLIVSCSLKLYQFGSGSSVSSLGNGPAPLECSVLPFPVGHVGTSLRANATLSRLVGGETEDERDSLTL